MIAELGHFSLILALSLAIVQGILPLWGTLRGDAGMVAMARPAAMGQFLFLAISFVALTYLFVYNDFSVSYVANHSNSALPLEYRISAVWGGHEGSLLLWALMLTGWGAAVALFSRDLPQEMVARVLAVMGLIGIGFMLFMLLTSNPFDRLFPAPADGRDLNPLLQDPGLIIHPPLLYMGYVGFSVAFAFAIAALLSGRLDSAWARWSRPWTTVAWVFLTLGIAIGSWWAYYELGWGGWWFWDPVENASFMPWIVGTALMHSLAVTEKRASFKSWTVLLAIFAFSLSLLGTFLVRSGVLTSVHAFATDPARGVFILAFLAVVVGSSLTLYAWRAPAVKSTGVFGLVSRETTLLGNNVLLVVVAATILLGTIYPLLLDALGAGKISVGPPYFNKVFIPLMVPLFFLMGIGPAMRWKGDDFAHLSGRLRRALIISLVLAVVLQLIFTGGIDLSVGLGLLLAIWIAATVVEDVYRRARHRDTLWAGLKAQPRAFFGMHIAHLGVAVSIVGVALSSAYSIEKDVRLAVGESMDLGTYVFHFDALETLPGPNYRTNKASIRVMKGDDRVAVLHPEKRIYRVQNMPMTEAGIDAGFTRDIYVALGEPLESGAWAVRLYVKPFVRWIWLGSIFMAIGGLLAAMDRRYRIARRRLAQGAKSGSAAAEGVA